MGSENMGSLVSNFKLSSVVPATVTGENKVHELTHMDLAMKLHYIQGVYFFRREAVEGLSILNLKEPMFQCLDHYFTVSGRVRRSETGRPFIKCNDSGVRIVEADCDATIEEFLAMKDHCFHGSLVYNQVLGPDLAFSPLVIIQVLLARYNIKFSKYEISAELIIYMYDLFFQYIYVVFSLRMNTDHQ